jgi:hypothetical protein
MFRRRSRTELVVVLIFFALLKHISSTQYDCGHLPCLYLMGKFYYLIRKKIYVCGLQLRNMMFGNTLG